MHFLLIGMVVWAVFTLFQSSKQGVAPTPEWIKENAIAQIEIDKEARIAQLKSRPWKVFFLGLISLIIVIGIFSIGFEELFKLPQKMADAVKPTQIPPAPQPAMSQEVVDDFMAFARKRDHERAFANKPVVPVVKPEEPLKVFRKPKMPGMPGMPGQEGVDWKREILPPEPLPDNPKFVPVPIDKSFGCYLMYKIVSENKSPVVIRALKYTEKDKDFYVIEHLDGRKTINLKESFHKIETINKTEMLRELEKIKELQELDEQKRKDFAERQRQQMQPRQPGMTGGGRVFNTRMERLGHP